MVEFVKKTIALKDCTLDATYSDLYDGSSPYLKVGGILEPKKALLRFQIAEKPTYGDAELSSGEIGFFSTDIKLGNSANFPTFNLYKIKTSPTGRDWGSDGRIRPVPRGKQVVSVETDSTESNTFRDSIKVLNHDLSTGDRIWWSPVNARYDDCFIAGITPEVEYYVIKIDRNNLSFADSIANAIAGTRIDLTGADGTGVGDTLGGENGYIRSDTYNMDIHVISATPNDDRETVSENFNGSPYRESDLEFEYVQRVVTRRGLPYLGWNDVGELQDNPYEHKLWGEKQGSEGSGDWWKIGTAVHEESHSNLRKWYGNGEENNENFRIYLTSKTTKSDGTGWWETTNNAGFWKGGHDYVAKKNTAVKWDHESPPAEAIPYGDEVTPENCMFHRVVGAAEFQELSATDDADNVLQATGAIRLSTKKALTGGQSCNIYQFWKLDGLGITYNSQGMKDWKPGTEETARQECLMLYKGLPFPNKNWTQIDKGTHGHGQFPYIETGATDSNIGSGDMCVSMTVNFDKLEMAYTKPSTITTNGSLYAANALESDITLRRSFTVIFAAVAPESGDSLASYVRKLAGPFSHHAAVNASSSLSGDVGSTPKSDYVTSACGYSIVNTNLGLQIYPLDALRINIYNSDIYAPAQNSETGLSSGVLGVDTYSGYKNTPSTTLMEEGEWYTIKVYFPEALNQQGALVVENSAGEPVHYVGDTTKGWQGTGTAPDDEFWENNPIVLSNIRSGTQNITTPWHLTHPDEGAAAKYWYQHMSIWVTNVESAYDTNDGGTTGHPGTDWMASEDDRDTSNNIFIDRIGVTGVNLGHENATVGQEKGTRSRIFIQGNQSYTSVDADEGADITHSGGEVKYSSDNRDRRADNLICLGFEDPSQILSNYKREKSWRYLFWHGYTTGNIGADNKIGWTSDNTLPDLTYSGTGTLRTNRWFSSVPDNAYRSTGSEANIGNYPNDSSVEVLDAGAPYTYSEDNGEDLRPCISAFYSDGHVSHGGQLSDEALDIRELWRNHTYNDTAVGRKGARQSMYKSVPSLGAIFDSKEGITVSNGLIQILAGPNGNTRDSNIGNGVFWQSGQKVIYYNINSQTVGITGSEDDLVTATGFFNDAPKVYFWQRVTDSTGYLHDNYDNSITGTSPLHLIRTTDAERHHLYDYDYYMNRKYWIDGWSSKGLSRFILEPVGGSLTTDSASTPISLSGFKHVRQHYLSAAASATDLGAKAPVELVGDILKDSSATQQALLTVTGSTPLDLTKREHIACAAKILEIEGPTVEVKTDVRNSRNTYKVRVDSTEQLRSTDGTTYRVFFTASPNTSAYYASGLSIKIIDAEHIEILGWNGLSDGIGEPLVQLVMTETQSGFDDDIASSMCRLWIGPEKYWVSFLIRNQTGDSFDTFGNLPLKTYSAVSVCSPFGGTNENEHAESADTYDAWGVPGATYNEFSYNADKVSGVRGAYANSWSPSPNLDPNLTIFDLEDYGFGGPKEDKDGLGGENGVIGGYVGKFIPREAQVNRIKMPKIFSAGEEKVEGDYLDLAIQQESLNSDAIMTMASTDNNAYPNPFLLTVFKDIVPAMPTDFKVTPYEKDPFYPEFKWSASDSDLWYGFIIVDDTPINNQYHRSILHVPLDEDLSAVATSYDDDKGWYYSPSVTPIIYGYRYHNTDNTPSGIHALAALKDAGIERTPAEGVTIYDNVEGLAGNTKYFDTGSYVQFPFDTTSTDSGFTYPVDEMSILVHITPESWGLDRYIAAFNNPDDSDTPSWSLYLDAEGQINATVGAAAAATHPAHLITLRSATKLPVDGTPTCIILTIDTQIHSGNVKLYINGRLEDQSGLRGTLSINNWPTDVDGLGGDDIFYDTDGLEDLIIGAKNKHETSATRKSFIGRIEEFVWYDKVIYPVVPQDGTFVLHKPLEELVDGVENASSKSYTARLFIKDYHNIRGKTSGEVAASSQLSFRKAAFELKT